MHEMDKPYMDANENFVDGAMPGEFWDHMATAFNQQRPSKEDEPC